MMYGGPHVTHPPVAQISSLTRSLLTVRRLDFKQNCKYFRRNLRWINEYASEIQNIFYLKS